MTHKVDFETLVEKHSKEIYSYLWRMMGDAEEARDCLQDSFIRAFRAYSRLDEEANTRAWLYKIATNSARTQLKRLGRHKDRHSFQMERLASREAAMEDQVEQRERHAEVMGAVMALPHKQRAALMLRKYQEMGYAEIAEALDCSQESARANVYQGLRKLRKQLAEKVSN